MGNDFAIKHIPENWELTTLGELLDKEGGAVQTGPFGSQLHASDYVAEGIPSVMPKNITIEGINEDDIARITQDDANRLKKYLLTKGDIVYSRRGDVEKCALVKSHEKGWLCGTGCLRVRLGDNSKLTPEYLHSYLSTPAIREWISRNAIGATMPNLNTGILKDVPLVVPTKESVQFIAEIWLDLNSKINLNRQTNQTLEQMAQTLFKSWFVDFDPVFDNALAKADFQLDKLASDFPAELLPKAQARLSSLQERALQATGAHSGIKGAHSKIKGAHSDSVGLSKSADASVLNDAIHPYFPSEFEYNEQLGWIPKGWRSGTLADVAKYSVNRMDGSKLSIENYVSTENMLSGKKGVSKASSIPTVKTTPAFSVGQVLISNIRPYFKKVWFATTNGGRSNDVLGFETLVLQTEAYLMNLLYQDDFFDYMMRTSKGSKMPRGDKRAIMDWELVIPPVENREIYSQMVKNFYEANSIRKKENDSLTKLRDTLLPKLISGELEIPDTLKALEQATS